MLDALKGLLFENNKLSLGRVMSWLVFGVMNWYWLWKQVDIPENMLYVFGFCMTYQVTKKMRDLGHEYVEKINGKVVPNE